MEAFWTPTQALTLHEKIVGSYEERTNIHENNNVLLFPSYINLGILA
jgi:hypothetical protein